MSIFSNCGQFLPGQRPIYTGPKDVVDVGPCIDCIIPPDGEFNQVILTTDYKFKCEDWQFVLCPDVVPPVVQRVRRRCTICNGAAGNPAPNDPGCLYDSGELCTVNCVDSTYPCPATPTKYKCVLLEREYCPSPHSSVIKRSIRACLPCDGKRRPGNPNLFNPSPNEPGCTFDSAAQCVGSPCVDTVVECPDNGSGGGGSGRGPAGPTTGGPDGRRPGGPTTGGPAGPSAPAPGEENAKYVCVIIARIDCAPGFVGVQELRECIECVKDPENPGRFVPPASGPNGALPPQTIPSLCEDLETCRTPRLRPDASAIPDARFRYTGGCVNRDYCKPIDYSTVILTQSETTSQVNQVVFTDLPQGSAPPQGQQSSQNSSNNNIIQTQNVYANVINLYTRKHNNRIEIDIAKEANKNESKIVPTQVGERNSLYHPKYNFFRLETQNIPKDSKFIPNAYYRNIFGELVAEEIDHVLKRTNTNQSYSEVIIQSITPEKIALSLNPVLLNALTNIHDASNQKVPPTAFFKAIRKHLVTGTLDEFDPNFYINLADKQRNDVIKVYSNTLQPQQLLEKYALSIINNTEAKSDLDDKDEYQASLFRRSRRLNVDINARTCFTNLCGESSEITIDNAGLNITKFTNPALDDTVEDVVMPNGDGYGYYLYLNSSKYGCVSYQYDTDVSSAKYISPEVRFEALSVMRKDPYIKITAESPVGNHEFASGVTYTPDLAPVYLKLDLSSVSSLPSDNLIVDSISASYIVLTDQNEIDEHTDSHGLNVSRVNIDYKDPIFRYIKQSGKINYNQLDINFKNSGKNRGLANQSILTSNLAFGLVVRPVMGSKFNPFNGYSNIESFTGNKVVRSVKFMPSIDVSDFSRRDPILDKVFVFDVKNDYKIGIAEPADSQALTFRFNSQSESLTNSFYDKTTQSYTASTVTSIPDRGLAYLIKESLDYLIQTYPDKQSFTWYDVYRRLPMNKFSEILYETPELFNELAYGLRNNVKIVNVLNRANNDLTEVLPDDEKVIIKETDR